MKFVIKHLKLFCLLILELINYKLKDDYIRRLKLNEQRFSFLNTVNTQRIRETYNKNIKYLVFTAICYFHSYIKQVL